MLIKRERYLRKIRQYYDIDLIKVITGIRRCGKSKLLEAIMREIEDSGILKDHIIYINFEDFDYEFIKNAENLHTEIKNRVVDENKYYIFLDEIQNVQNFEKAIASFKATLNVSIFVTGSNSKLLSGELATLLTGRTIDFEIQPFSFLEMKEYFERNNKDFNEDYIYDYIKWGGFPQRFEFLNEEAVRKYLSNLYESIIVKDIMVNANSFDKDAFKQISLYIMSNAGKELSVDSIVHYYNNKNNNNKKTITRGTVYNYIEKMEKAYLIKSVKRYNIIGKEALKSREKKYAVDMGLRTINTNTINFEDTFYLENIIYNELVLKGFQIFTGKTYKGEVDFVAIKDGKKCFIQVSYLLASQTTIDREFNAFKPITDSSPKYVLSLDKIDMSKDGIKHINIIDFLLGEVELIVT
ncbi:ATP-binding protein [Amedibacillus sp. YH-ame6]